MKEETELEQRVVNVCNQYASVLQPKDVQAYELLFRFGDRDGSGDLSLDEIMTVTKRHCIRFQIVRKRTLSQSPFFVVSHSRTFWPRYCPDMNVLHECIC